MLHTCTVRLGSCRLRLGGDAFLLGLNIYIYTYSSVFRGLFIVSVRTGSYLLGCVEVCETVRMCYCVLPRACSVYKHFATGMGLPKCTCACVMYYGLPCVSLPYVQNLYEIHYTFTRLPCVTQFYVRRCPSWLCRKCGACVFLSAS